MIKKISKNDARKKRHMKIRNTIKGTEEVPRLNVFRSNSNITAQIIDDKKGVTLVSASSVDLKLKNNNIETAEKVGAELAKRAKKAGVTEVVFDRGGYLYHGRVKALADAARKGGLKF